MRRETFTILVMLMLLAALGAALDCAVDCFGCTEPNCAGSTAPGGCEWVVDTCMPKTGGGGGDTCASLSGFCCTTDLPVCPDGNTQFATGCGQKPEGPDWDCCKMACVAESAPVTCTGGDPVGICCTEGNTACGGTVYDDRTGCESYLCCSETCGPEAPPPATPEGFVGHAGCPTNTGLDDGCCDPDSENAVTTTDCICNKADSSQSWCEKITYCAWSGICSCAPGYTQCPGTTGKCYDSSDGNTCCGDPGWQECCTDEDCPGKTCKDNECVTYCDTDEQCGYYECNTVSHWCKDFCITGYTECNNECKANPGKCCDTTTWHAGEGKCCVTGDCTVGGQVCMGNTCTTPAECSETDPCTGNFACVESACSADTCVTGYTLCGSTCNQDPGKCCDTTTWHAGSGKCCAKEDCTGEQECVGNTCTAPPECSDTDPCAGNFACVSDVCSTDTCVTGYTLCGTTCNQDPGKCCDTTTWHAGSGKCCVKGDCTGDQVCTSNTCTAPAVCSDTSPCAGSFACVSDACSPDTCVTGYTFCGTTCNQDPGKCCDTTTWHAGTGKCCVNGDCTVGGQVCTGNTCTTPAACSDTSPCADNFACVSDACSPDTCVTGYTFCGTTCNQDPGKCCDTTTWHAGTGKCCVNGDCTVGGQVCTGNTCTTPPACSDTNLCASNFACVSDACSTDTCVTGYTFCGTTCNQDPGKCCDTTTWHAGTSKCCVNGDCTGAGKTCTANACVDGGGTGTPAGCTDVCTGMFACIDGTCSTTDCVAGFALCAGACKLSTTGMCCDGTWTAGATCCKNEDCTDPAKQCQANKCENLVCTSCQMASNHICVARTGGGKCCTDAWIAGAACCTDADCTAEGETCQSNQCSSLACDVGQVPCGTTCYAETEGKCCQGTWYAGGQCCDDSMCGSDKSCDASKTCIAIACTVCQEVSNHQCVGRTGGKCCTGAWYAGGDCCENVDCRGGQYCDTNAHLCRDFSTMPPGQPTPVTTMGPTTSGQPPQPQPSSTPPATPSKAPLTVCGDLQCSEGETSKSCCTDCGCDPGYRCKQNQCIKQDEDINAVCGDNSCDVGENYNTCCADCGCPGEKRCKNGVCVDSQDNVQKVMDVIMDDEFAKAKLNELRGDGWTIGKPELSQTAEGEYDVVINARKGNERIAITAQVDTKAETMPAWHVPETDPGSSISVQTLLIGVVIAIIGIGAMYVMQGRTQVVVVQAPPPGQAAPPTSASSADYDSGGGEDEDLPDWFQ